MTVTNGLPVSNFLHTPNNNQKGFSKTPYVKNVYAALTSQTNVKTHS